jgi:hypothetical protein
MAGSRVMGWDDSGMTARPSLQNRWQGVTGGVAYKESALTVESGKGSGKGAGFEPMSRRHSREYLRPLLDDAASDNEGGSVLITH